MVSGAIAGLVPKMRETDWDNTGLFPVKLFLILACGTPAIVSDYPGQADLVRSRQCSIVIPPENPGALAKAFAKLANDEASRVENGQAGPRAHRQGTHL